jgi:preprotein translocase subunit SecF
MVRNIYESKHYKLFILIPVALMLISLIFIPHIQLDSTLRGGISVQLQTNTTPDTRALTSAINGAIPGAQASVSRAPGGLSITMVDNQSLATAQASLLTLYSAYSNYSQYDFNLTAAQAALSQQQSNSTLAAIVATSQKGVNVSSAQMLSAFGAESAALVPVLGSATQPNSTTNYQALVNQGQSIYTTASAKYQSRVVSKLGSLVPFTSYSYNEVTATLGAYFLSEIEYVIIVAFILVAIAVFFIFRTPIPSFSVVFGATSDIVVALGAMGLLGIPLGVASVGGLLMLLGYSLDTDILTAVRILKRNDATPEARAFSTFKTGLTMTFTAIISFSVLFAVSYFAFIPTYSEISAVVLVGLVTDLITTWLANTPIIIWYKKRKDGVRSS